MIREALSIRLGSSCLEPASEHMTTTKYSQPPILRLSWSSTEPAFEQVIPSAVRKTSCGLWSTLREYVST